MAAYKKGQNPYNGPYSPDFDESKVQGLSRDAYYPSRKPNVYTADSPPYGRKLDNTLDLSATIDKQVKYGHCFDDNKGADWSRDKSDAGLGGFAGVASRSKNHP